MNKEIWLIDFPSGKVNYFYEKFKKGKTMNFEEFVKDSKALSAEEIENKPGLLSAKIIFNSLVQNKLKIWLIGSPEGGGNFFYVQMQRKGSEGTFATIAFTEESLATSYINRQEPMNIILRLFGKKIFIVGVKLTCLQDMMNPSNITTLNSLLLNPNSKDFFIPIPLPYIKHMVDSKKLKYDPVADSNIELIEMEFNKEDKRYEMGARKEVNFIFDRNQE